MTPHENRLSESLQVGTSAARLVSLLSEKAYFAPQGENWRGFCSACRRLDWTLRVADGSDGAIVLWCVNGCSLELILAAISEPVYSCFPNCFGGLSTAKGKQYRDLQHSFASLDRAAKKVRATVRRTLTIIFLIVLNNYTAK